MALYSQMSYVDWTIVLVDLYTEVVPNSGEIVWLRQVTQAVILHRILHHSRQMLGQGSHIIST